MGALCPPEYNGGTAKVYRRRKTICAGFYAQRRSSAARSGPPDPGYCGAAKRPKPQLVSGRSPFLGSATKPVIRRVPAALRPRKLLKENGLEAGNLAWLGGRDSNPDSAGQSRMSYR